MGRSQPKGGDEPLATQEGSDPGGGPISYVVWWQEPSKGEENPSYRTTIEGDDLWWCVLEAGRVLQLKLLDGYKAGMYRVT